jgi:hypothetical protein
MSTPAGWNMKIPVLSTAHVPSREAPGEAAQFGYPVAAYESGWFIWVGDPQENDYGGPRAWMLPIAQWLIAAYPGTESNWVRFDSCGVEIPDLPMFDW